MADIEEDWAHDDSNIRAGAQMREYLSVADRVAAQTPGGSILDWGCGFGHVSDMLIQRGMQVTAFEYDPEGRSIKPLERYPHILAHHSSEPVALDFPDGEFDAVLSCGVLEHVPDPPASLAEIARILKPGGTLYVFKLAHRYSYLERIAKRLGLYYHGKYPNDRLYTLGQARALLEGSGYRIQVIRRANMLPLSMLTGGWGQRLAGPIWAANRLISAIPVVNLLATNVELIATPTEAAKTPSSAPLPAPGVGTGKSRLGSRRALVEATAARARWAGRAVRSREGRRSLRRAASFLAAKQISPVVAVDSGGVRYFVSSADRTVGAGTYVEGNYELDVMRYALDLTSELTGRPALTDRTFIDIGAEHRYQTSLPAVTQFGAARAIAFEPAPDAFKLLRLNVLTNDLESRINTVNVALSNTNGSAPMEVSAANWGDNRVRVGDRAEDGAFGEAKRAVVDVRLIRFDDVAGDLQLDMDSIGVVWIDTQGHEGHVLDGAASIVKSDVPVILEYWPYGLRRADGLGLLHRVIADNYRSVVDLRASQSEGKIVRLAAADIQSLEEKYGGIAQTDLLLLS